jgi:hypothetical protein
MLKFGNHFTNLDKFEFPKHNCQVMKKRLIRFVWYSYQDNPRLHQQRDSVILLELLPFLEQCGYAYYDSIFNYPGNSYEDKVFSYEFKDDDLILVTTRPPLHDDKQLNGSRKIYKTNHPIERHALNFIDQYCFDACSRNSTKLTEKLANQLVGEMQYRAHIDYRVHKCADYKVVTKYEPFAPSKKPKEKKSSAFIIFIEALGGFPKMLFVFGVGGAEGLIFSRILNKRLWPIINLDLNGPSRFLMYEIGTNYSAKDYSSISAVEGVKCDLVLDALLYN